MGRGHMATEGRGRSGTTEARRAPSAVSGGGGGQVRSMSSEPMSKAGRESKGRWGFWSWEEGLPEQGWDMTGYR